jgi:hypothetical protein
MKTFAKLLTEYMNRTGIRDGNLAWKIKVTRQTIYRWRSGYTKRPNCDKVAKCPEVLRLTPEERAEFLRAAGCPYELVTPPQESEKDILDEGPDIDIEDNAPAVPIVGIPISRPHQFFGRQKELQRIFKRWQHLPLQSVAIIGAKRSGKTSLLHYVKNIHSAKQLRDNQRQDWLPKGYQFVFVDFQAGGMCEQEPLLRYLLTELNMPVPNPCDLAHFTDTVRSQLQKPTVILMDKIEVALQSPQLDYQFWWGIRALITTQTNGKIGLLVASHLSPPELIPQGSENKPSPLLNIVGDVVTLGPFADTEARELFQHTPLPFAEADIQWILETSERWPAQLQQLCDARLTALEEGETDEAWKVSVQK